jgi:hypothetical protein
MPDIDPDGLPSVDCLRSLLRFDRDKGQIFWNRRGDRFKCDFDRSDSFDKKHAGQRAGMHASGRRPDIEIGRHKYAVEDIIFKLSWGRAPQGEIRFLNLNTSDCRSVNMYDEVLCQTISDHLTGLFPPVNEVKKWSVPGVQ